MQILPLSEFRANASAMLDLVAQGETVRIMRHGKPVADRVPVHEAGAPARLPHWKMPFDPTPVALSPLLDAQRMGAPW